MRLEGGRLGVGAERELEDCHPWKLQPLTKRLNVRRDHPEVLGHERQLVNTERGSHHLEQLRARSLHPLSYHRRTRVAEDLP